MEDLEIDLWRIIDKADFASVPSDIREAVSRLVRELTDLREYRNYRKMEDEILLNERREDARWNAAR